MKKPTDMSVTIYTEDDSQSIDDLDQFARKYEIVKAAGGLVTDDEAGCY